MLVYHTTQNVPQMLSDDVYQERRAVQARPKSWKEEEEEEDEEEKERKHKAQEQRKESECP